MIFPRLYLECDFRCQMLEGLLVFISVDKHTFFINHRFHDGILHFALRILNLKNNAPSIAYLNDVEQRIDILQTRRGNPDLKSFRSTIQDFNAIFSTGIFSIDALVSYAYEKNPIMESVIYEEGMFIHTYENQKSFQHLAAEVTFKIKPWKDHISLSVTPGINRYISTGNNYLHTYTLKELRINLDASYKNWLREDRDIAASVQTVLEKKGIVFHLNAKVQSVDGATVIYEDAVTHEIHHLEGDAILLATGRRPNTSGLNLEVAGVKVNERGAIIVDEWLRTTNPAIRAIGDVKGGLQFTYISLDDYRIIREDLFGAGERRTDDREPVSYSVFMDPPLARVGLSEMEARKKGLNIKVNTLPVAAIPRARTLGETDGLFKVVVDADTNKILGCSLFGPGNK